MYLPVPGLNCTMQYLVPCPGIKPGPPALRAQILSHWTTREVPIIPKSLDELCLCPPGLSSAVGN